MAFRSDDKFVFRGVFCSDVETLLLFMRGLVKRDADVLTGFLAGRVKGNACMSANGDALRRFYNSLALLDALLEELLHRNLSDKTNADSTMLVPVWKTVLFRNRSYMLFRERAKGKERVL